MIVRGYENYDDPKFINPSIWDSVNEYYSPNLYVDHWHMPKFRNMCMIEDRPLFDDMVDEDRCTTHNLKNHPAFDLKHYVLKAGDSLFFDPACSIPRYSGSEMFKRVIKIEKADAIVLPRPKPLKRYKYCAVFRSQKQLVVMEEYDKMSIAPTLGETVEQVFKKNKPYILERAYDNYWSEGLNTHKDAVCIYLGAVLFYPNDDEFLLKVLDGTYSKVIFEDDLMTAIGIAGQKFDYDTVQHLIMMLRSDDIESRHLALRTLTSMDYDHYPSVTRYILKNTSSYWRELNVPSSVTFMRTHVGYSAYDNPFINVLPTEFELARQLYIAEVKNRIANIIKDQCTNLKISHTIELDMELPLNNTDQ